MDMVLGLIIGLSLVCVVFIALCLLRESMDRTSATTHKVLDGIREPIWKCSLPSAQADETPDPGDVTEEQR
jgi:hypothetical protein